MSKFKSELLKSRKCENFQNILLKKNENMIYFRKKTRVKLGNRAELDIFKDKTFTQITLFKFRITKVEEIK